MSVHEDTLQGLQELLDYAKGDKSKARSVTIEMPDDEINFYKTYKKLSESNKQRVMRYASELLQASNG